MVYQPISEIRRRGKSTMLAVVLHGYMHTGEAMEGVANVLETIDPDCDLYVPTMNIGLFSTDIDTVVADIFLKVDRICSEREREIDGGYGRIIFVGHSLGSLISRKIYVCACGPEYSGPLEDIYKNKFSGMSFPRSWSFKVERIILLAGMNRGWRISHHLAPLTLVQWYFGNILARFVEYVIRRPLVILSMKRGAYFITQLRVQWITMKNERVKKQRLELREENILGGVMTVQLLGSIDDFVSPEDNIDLISGKDFVYLDVPYSDHVNITDMDSAEEVTVFGVGLVPNKEKRGELRRKILRQALTETKEGLEKIAVIPSDDLPPESSEDVTDVVFVIHGIRDTGHWTHKIARCIQKTARESGHQVRIATETSSYGYFAMLPFLFPGVRRRKVAWLMDEYTEALARYPNAKFSFVGHSNGTYMLARAVQQYSSCHFKRVVFAGSVVSRTYDWQKTRGQIDAVLNYVATADWVVAIFPKFFQTLRLQDLGSAGHDGFHSDMNAGKDFVHNNRYVRGGHGAAIVEENWDHIAQFILDGKNPPIPDGIMETEPRCWVRLFGILSPVIWLALVGILALVACSIWNSGLSEGARVLLLVVLAVSVWKVVTTV